MEQPAIKWRNEIELLECQYQAIIDDLEYKLKNEKLLHAREVESLVHEYEEQLRANLKRDRQQSDTSASPVSFSPLPPPHDSHHQRATVVSRCDQSTSTADLDVVQFELQTLRMEQQALRSVVEMNEHLVSGWDMESESIPFDAKWKPGLLLEMLKWCVRWEVRSIIYSAPQCFFSWRQKVFALLVENARLQSQHAERMRDQKDLVIPFLTFLAAY